jgi:RimJ/RimL family protein N-acetyltransferase
LKTINIYPLGMEDIDNLQHMLSIDDPSYRRYFHVFDEGLPSLKETLSEIRLDVYWAVRVNQKLAGVFMLRGLDHGFSTPSFGVYITQVFSGQGLSKLALNYAISWCKLNEHREIMLTVHHDNLCARYLYEKEGFRFTNQYSNIGHEIWRKTLLHRD